MVQYNYGSIQIHPQGFSGDSDGKESAHNVGDLGSITELGRSPGAGYGYPLHQNPSGQRNMEGYGPWDCKESAMTE